MYKKQNTLSKPVKISGTGLHTNVEVNMTFLPAEEDFGIKFQRIDVEGHPIIEAIVENVVDTSRSTTLGKNGVIVSTTEHVLAALVSLEIDNVLIQIDNSETPILDGSAIQFIRELEQGGIKEQDVLREYFEIPETITYCDKENEIEIIATPAEDYTLNVVVDFRSKVLPPQHASLQDFKTFIKEYADARTFCFLHELDFLYKNNLVKGGALNNAIIVVEDIPSKETVARLKDMFSIKDINEIKDVGILNPPLKYSNEFARHKLLDAVGDFVLLGKRIKGNIFAMRTGHAANVEFIKKLKKVMTAPEKSDIFFPCNKQSLPVHFDTVEISKKLPHQEPFLLVDTINYIDKKQIVGTKSVTYNEPFFSGHFPGNPVMPGVLILEVLAQTGAIFVLESVENPSDYWTYFLKINECKFKKTVHPGSVLTTHCLLLEPIKRGLIKMQGRAFVGNELVTDTILLAKLVRKNK